MNSFANALAPTSVLDDDGWDDLLSFDCLALFGTIEMPLASGDAPTARSLTARNLARIRALEGLPPEFERHRQEVLFYEGDVLGRAEYQLGDAAASERALRDALSARMNFPLTNNGDRRDTAAVSTLLAMSLARQGRLAESREVIAPVVKLHRELAARNDGASPPR